MLSEDAETQAALAALLQELRVQRKKWLFWIGAGASRWCGYPGWQDFAAALHSEWSRAVSGYEKARSGATLDASDFPGVFQFCSESDKSRYFRRLTEAFSPRPPSAVYARLIAALSEFSPLHLVTTNIDELLEKNVPTAATVGRYDIEHALELLSTSTSFIAKLHGTVSDVQSIVFTNEDYQALLSPEWRENLGRLLAQCSVVFVGYGLRDQYLLDLLSTNSDLKRLFGDGPHFAVLSDAQLPLPTSVHVIRYTPHPHADHRTALDVLEELRAELGTNPHKRESANDPNPLRSAHFFFDLAIPGTSQSSITARAESKGDPDRQALEIVIGPGFTDAELPNLEPTAMHDLIVGLLCFDKLVFALGTLGKIHLLLGSDRFWRLFREGIFEFVNWSHEVAVVYPTYGAFTGGSLGLMQIHRPDMTLRSTGDLIRKQLLPAPGAEKAAERLFADLETRTRLITEAEEGSIPGTVRSLLLRPSIKRLIGLSGGTPITSVPKWHMFPVLRLAQVARVGTACRLLGIASAKLDFGTSVLAGPAFAAAPGKEWADQIAGYVVCGSFSANVGANVLANPQILDSVLAFRETSSGRALRENVFSSLAANRGGDVSLAVNSALRSALPVEVLQQARDEFIRLSEPTGAASASKVLLWTDQRAEQAIAGWRRRSKGMLDQVRSSLKLGPYSPCPCGSGEKLKFCCEAALAEPR